MSADDNGLPDGWRLHTISELAGKPQYGWTTRARQGDGVKLLRTTDITSREVNWESVPVCEEIPQDISKYTLRPEDIVVSRAGSVGFSYLLDDATPTNAIFASYLMRIHPNATEVLPKYLHHFMRSPYYWRQVSDAAVGVGLANVNGSKLGAMTVPVAPLEQQHSLVALLDGCNLRQVSAEKHVANAIRDIERFRQAVLAAACSGRLTQDWREANSSIDDTAKADSAVDVLPQSWSLQSVLALCEVIIDCAHSTPKWVDEGSLCVRTNNFKPGLLDLSDVRFVTRETFELRNRRLPPRSGDILFSREGSILGIACTIPPGVELCMGQRMMLLRPAPTQCTAEYLMHALNAPLIQAEIRELTGGTASPHLNVADVKRFIVPTPPLDEQFEIIRRVRKLMEIAESVKRRASAASRNVNRASHAVLAKAFRGDIGSTNAVAIPPVGDV